MGNFVFGTIFSIAIFLCALMYFGSDKLQELNELNEELSITVNANIFNSIEECQSHKGQIDIPCDIAFNVAKKKAHLIAKQIDGLVTCKKFFDKHCSSTTDGYFEPTMTGIIYINTKVPTIAPVFKSPTTNNYQLASGCIVRKTDKTIEFDGSNINLFKFLNYQNQNQEIRIPSGKTHATYQLRHYIDRHQNDNLKRRLRSCMKYTN